MGEVHAVLLVPHQGDRSGLLADGLCGARPPMLMEWRCYRDGCLYNWWEYRAPGAAPVCAECGDWESVRLVRKALVLAWDGKLAAEGMDRLDWAQHRGAGWPGRGRTANFTPHHPLVPESLWRTYECGWLACHGGDHKGRPGLGTLVLLDADGREVTDG